MTTAIWWIRRDLRLYDNPALTAAVQHADQVIPLFIFDPALLNSRYASDKRKIFLLANLQDLDIRLRQSGSLLYTRNGLPQVELAKFIQETNASSIFVEPDYSPYARQRDQALSGILPIHWVGSPAVHPPGSVLRQDGGIFTVFTPFSKAWKLLSAPTPTDLLAAPSWINTPSTYQNPGLPGFQNPTDNVFPPGEEEAQRRLQRFTSNSSSPIFRYAEDRNRPDIDGTSKLSPYLRFGILSPKQAVVHAMMAIQSANSLEARKSAETWLNELIWREFYIHILYHFPEVRQKNFRLGTIAWQNDPNLFQSWCEGKTGYPIVDAAMRQLFETGWMHNRTRMIAASFLTKDLLIDWRWGEQYFMQHLIDGDPAANNGGWQWSAGTGTDAAPYFRIFNPLTQSIKFDPNGNYIRRWLPELAHVSDQFIHDPSTMPVEEQRASICILGKDYPYPIVDHAWARQRVLHVYGNAK